MSGTGQGGAASTREQEVRKLLPTLLNLEIDPGTHYRGVHVPMDDFNSDTDSDYTSYWRDWVSTLASYTVTIGIL